MPKKNRDINTSIQDDINYDGRKESDFSKVTLLLLNNQFKRRKTILNEKQVTKITTLDVVGQLYDVQFLKYWVSDYAEWRTSGGGQGRQDVVDIAKFQHAENKEMQKEMMSILRGQ